MCVLHAKMFPASHSLPPEQLRAKTPDKLGVRSRLSFLRRNNQINESNQGINVGTAGGAVGGAAVSDVASSMADVR